MKEREFYCVGNCRKKVTQDKKDICVKIYKNKRAGDTPALRSVCYSCGTNLTKFIKRDSTKKLTDRYGKC